MRIVTTRVVTTAANEILPLAGGQTLTRWAMIQPLASNAGTTYIGNRFVTAREGQVNGVHMLDTGSLILPPPELGGRDTIDLADVFVTSSSSAAGEGVVVLYLID